MVRNLTIDMKTFREKVIKNCKDLINAAKLNFEKKNYPISAFLSITAIEEISKIWLSLKFIQFKKKFKPRRKDFESLLRITLSLPSEKSESVLYEKTKKAKQLILKMFGPYTIEDLDVKQLRQSFRSRPGRSHAIKQELGILGSLTVNSRAYRKLGPAIIEKYIAMAKAGQLFDLRNQCLYLDVVGNSLITPNEIITRDMTLELVCLAIEVVAEISDFGAAFLDNKYGMQVTNLWLALIKEADEFEEKHNLIPKKKVAKVTNYLSRIKVAIIDLTDDLKVSDEVIIQGPKTFLRQKMASIEIDHKKVTMAKAGSRIGLKVDKPVRRNDLVYLIIQ